LPLRTSFALPPPHVERQMFFTMMRSPWRLLCLSSFTPHYQASYFFLPPMSRSSSAILSFFEFSSPGPSNRHMRSLSLNSPPLFFFVITYPSFSAETPPCGPAQPQLLSGAPVRESTVFRNGSKQTIFFLFPALSTCRTTYAQTTRRLPPLFFSQESVLE